MKAGYVNLGHNGRVTSNSTVLLVCDECSCDFTRVNKSQIRMEAKPLYVKDYCPKCWRKVLNSRPDYKKSMSVSIKEKYKDPAWAAMQKASKIGINQGEKNGMKQIEARQKVSKARVAFFESSENRENTAAAVRQAWADGKYDGVPVGRCKWFTMNHPSGTSFKVQGTWERAYASYLIHMGISFEAHKGRISYVDEGVLRNYYPDFYLIDEGVYVDIKNRYHFKSQKRKFELLKMQHPDITIRLIFGDELRDKGILND